MQNADGTKFCRGCGTNLEPVALALVGQSSLTVEPRAGESRDSENAQGWIKKKGEAVRDIAQGAILITVSLLIAILAAFAVPSNIPWFAVWTVFFGWMAGWGAISLATGFGHFIESVTNLRYLHPEASTSPLAPDRAGEALHGSSARPALEPFPPASITENTTEPLRKPGVRDARE